MRKYPIYHLSFKTQHLLASTFVRFQEFYESPRFAGRVFTLEEFMDWYAGEHGAFTYFSDWVGFNIPSDILEPFRRGDFDPLAIKEARLLELFQGTPAPFYVIGTYGESNSIIHEIVHGLYFVDPEYRRKVQAKLAQFKLGKLRTLLLGSYGYGERVIDDEINAYLLSYLTEKMKRLDLVRATRALRAVFREHFGLNISDKKDQRKLLRRIHRQRFRI